MQRGLTINELAAKITANQKLKHDFVADTRALAMQVKEDDEGRKVPVLERQGKDTFQLLPLAHDQIGSRLNIPAKYYRRMLTEAPDLLATNVNAWFRLNPEKRMVRCLDGKARAFLSNQYNRIENEEIAETVLPILAAIPGVEVVSSQITDTHLYIQAVTPRKKAVKVGDEVQAGVVISNSEVGAGAVRIERLVWRLRCLNGMILPDNKFRANHVGRRVDEGDLIQYADDTKRADDRAVLLKVRDHVQHAVDETVFDQHVLRMTGLASSARAEDPVAAVEVLAQKVLNVGEGEQNSILQSLIKGGDLSAWGFLNAVTDQAHKTKDYDRAVEFEAMGGKLFDLQPKEWDEVLNAN